MINRDARTPEEWRASPTIEQDAEILHCREMGWTYRKIADHLGYKVPSAISERMRAIYARALGEPLEIVRDMEIRRLDRMLEVAWQLILRSYVAVSQGRVVTRRVTDENGEYVIIPDVYDDHGNVVYYTEECEDTAPILAAMDRALKIGEQRAKLLGLNAPKRVEVFTVDAITEEINRLSEELVRNGVDPALVEQV